MLKDNFLCEIEKTDEAEEDAIEELDGFLEESEPCWPEVSEKLALVGNKMFSKPIAADTMKEPMNRLLRPKDMDQLVVPRVNQEIWGKG